MQLQPTFPDKKVKDQEIALGHALESDTVTFVFKD